MSQSYMLSQNQVCKNCQVEKPHSEFYKHRRAKSGFRQPCKDCCKEYENERYLRLKESGAKYIKNKKESQRARSLKNKFGITLEQYDQLLEEQDYSCAICKKHEGEFNRKFAVDHAHTGSDHIPEGMVRGLLCWSCNRLVIGKQTNPDIFQRAADYLRRHTGWKVPENQIRPKQRRKKRRKKT